MSKPGLMEIATEPLLILCGGFSRRMGRPKPLLPFRGVPLIERLAAAANRPLWIASAGQHFPNLPPALYLPDALPERQGALSPFCPHSSWPPNKAMPVFMCSPATPCCCPGK